MKKIVLLLIATTLLLAINTKAQKSGILKKDHYGAFSGDDWEDFLAGKRAEDFNKKSNVLLATYIKDGITPYVAKELKEPTIAAAVANSTVAEIPEGTDVLTVGTDGVWFTRKAYKGEKGFLHNPTGKFWMSFQCGNLCNVALNKPAGTYTGPGNVPGNGNPNPGNQSGLTINNNFGQQENGKEISYKDGKKIADEAQLDYRRAMYDAMAMEQMQSRILIDMQNAKQCCTGGQSQIVAQPSLYAAAAPASASGAQQVVYVQKGNGVPFRESFLGQSLETATGFTLGTFTVRGIDAIANKIAKNNNMVYLYGNNSIPVTSVGFNGSNQMGNILSTGGAGSAGTGYSNEWPQRLGNGL